MIWYLYQIRSKFDRVFYATSHCLKTLGGPLLGSITMGVSADSTSLELWSAIILHFFRSSNPFCFCYTSTVKLKYSNVLPIARLKSILSYWIPKKTYQDHQRIELKTFRATYYYIRVEEVEPKIRENVVF